MSAIVANPAEVSCVTDVVSDAFLSDPVWSWVFHDKRSMRAYWAMFIKSALRFPFVFRTRGYEAVSVWIPPEGTAFLPEDAQSFEQILEELCGERASEVAGFLDKFDEAHPRSEPHYYLGLLGTASQHRGQGIGMSLLGQNLKLMDELQMPAYLESSNELNNPKYAALGFESVSSFQVPGNGPIVTGMWRAPRS
ncbi:GNAT family N-acetyltransferase [Paraburkholderia sp. 1N]|uniref:GNAT family N-acetyltransferase n=1 Tax=Paraburkholderia solitsugae TaxID=2675748 RepID=A0ABX2BYA0_9BURK|nr:GNAT family N-acetyltransferase [Paraburkholderia solitsugae]NPT45741.1 GNAT family N-acetyltransferase [Paraburkholderia solitsugae]